MKYTEEELEQIIDEMKEFLSSYKEADDKFRDDQDSKYWHDKYGERFAPYEDKIKLLNGDNFSLMDEARKEYHSQYSDLTDDEYCDALENNIKATLQRIWPDAEPEQIEQATEEVKDAVEEPGKEEKAPEEEPTKEEIHIESEDKDGDGEISKDETEVHTMEEKSEADKEDDDEDEEEEEDPLDSFTKELEETKKSLPKRE